MLLIVGQTDQSSVVGYSIILRHSKTENKVNLELGGGVNHKLVAISHSDFGGPNIGWREHRKEQGGAQRDSQGFQAKMCKMCGEGQLILPPLLS